MPDNLPDIPADFPVQGTTHGAYARVRDEFRRNFLEDVEVGASVCVVVDGQTVVDLWGGYCDRGSTIPWQKDTLVNLYSSTKGIAALTFATLIDQGLVRYEDPVSRYWPQLRAAANGLTVGELLAHKGGICGVSERVTIEDLYDWDKMCHLLERQEPFWVPGAMAGYHAVVWGFLIGELAKRVTGMSLGDLVRARISEPLGVDCYVGLPEPFDERVAPLIGPNHARLPAMQAGPGGNRHPELYRAALMNPGIRPYQDASSLPWRRAELAAANGHGNARAMARIYGAVARGGEVDGVQILSAQAIVALVKQEWGMEEDLVLDRSIRRGRGVILNTDGMFGPSPDSFGHSGAGGSVGFADPKLGIGFGYAMNQMHGGSSEETRAMRLVKCLYDCYFERG